MPQPDEDPENGTFTGDGTLGAHSRIKDVIETLVQATMYTPGAKCLAAPASHGVLLFAASVDGDKRMRCCHQCMGDPLNSVCYLDWSSWCRTQMPCYVG